MSEHFLQAWESWRSHSYTPDLVAHAMAGMLDLTQQNLVITGQRIRWLSSQAGVCAACRYWN